MPSSWWDRGYPISDWGQWAEGEQIFALPFYMVFGTCTPAVVLKPRFAKNVTIFISFKSTLFASKPSCEQRDRESFLGHHWHCPSSQKDPGI